MFETTVVESRKRKVGILSWMTLPVSIGLHVVVILAIIIVIFGANRLPGLAKGLGSSIKNFKEGLKDETPDQKS